MSLSATTAHEKSVNRRRSAGDIVMWSLCGSALVLLAVPVVWIFVQVSARAIPHFSWSFVTDPTFGNGGGLAQAIVGTMVIMAFVLVMAGIVGVGAGIWLAEFAPRRLGAFLRSAIELLAGVPSIVAGYVGWIALVRYFKWGESIWAATIVLSMIVVPYIAKTTELSLRGVPGSFREGAYALGMRDSLVLRRILLRAASPGIITGLILALAFAIGETAPLIYTAGWTDNMPSFGLHNSKIGYLTYPIYAFFNFPMKSADNLAAESAFFLVIMVTALIVASRFVSRYLSRYLPDARG